MVVGLTSYSQFSDSLFKKKAPEYICLGMHGSLMRTQGLLNNVLKDNLPGRSFHPAFSLDFLSDRVLVGAHYTYGFARMHNWDHTIRLRICVNILPTKWHRMFLGPNFFVGKTSGFQHTRMHGGLTLDRSVTGGGLNFIWKAKRANIIFSYMYMKYSDWVISPNIFRDYGQINELFSLGIHLNSRIFKKE
ncbi:MAG: hypothetical protein ACI9J3_003465 [Parvicellaceae bacterium]|jgi:hypothetical protein